MYMFIKDGNHTHRVEEGTVIRHSYRKAWEKDQECELSQVVLISSDTEVKVGTPYIEGVTVLAKVLGHVKDKKKIVAHFRRRKDSKTRKGHRQRFTRVKITGFRGIS